MHNRKLVLTISIIVLLVISGLCFGEDERYTRTFDKNNGIVTINSHVPVNQPGVLKKFIGGKEIVVKASEYNNGFIKFQFSENAKDLPNSTSSFAIIGGEDEGPLTDCAAEHGCSGKPTTVGVLACYAECAVIVLEDCIFEDCD